MVSLPVVLFAVLAGWVGVSALGVVLSTSLVRAAVWLLFTLLGVGGVYLLLGAEFLGAAQLIVYVGGTLVLVVFGVMLTASGPFQRQPPGLAGWLIGGGLAAGLFGLLVWLSLGFAAPPADVEQPLPGTGQLGLAFLGVAEPPTPGHPAPGLAYLLPFEIVSVHLLVVLVAAAYLARAKRKPSPEAGRG